ncbi:MAG: recombination mediator RecR [Candidatus Krumholzibacteria bacterium]|nr:recombination mediator RecR [Candidatus Krumholzibacteria bacterium]MDP6669326.1 recombination mediator RecR [Candidatus Krumholzibacteria bacterium]MDP6796765.1 recombination mediator RecR [Candidatus Krumholzibacteria bacterium]MDP7021681.1 recombination mediator RecR [Candidatus Krumholzibacteria bacterium]
MDFVSPLLSRLIRRLTRLPGIGERGAQRIALHLLHSEEEESRELSSLLLEVRENLGFCERCGFYSETRLCPLCMDTRRDSSLLCVVEQPVEVISLEKSTVYRGYYHVLGGVISPLDGIRPEDLSINALISRVKVEKISEVVLALSAGVEGETTSLYLSGLLEDLPVKVSRLARGLPVGSSLEYLDEATLSRAFEGRVKV